MNERVEKSNDSWPSYLSWFHSRRAGITEKILSYSRSNGMDPYQWLLDGFSAYEIALDLACGSAPLATNFPDAGWIGIDRSSGELHKAGKKSINRLVQGDVKLLPFCR